MIHFFLSTLFILFGFQTLNAQGNFISKLLDKSSDEGTGEIIENDILVGYYVFFTKEKTDKDNIAYEIQLFDDSYNLTKNFDIIRPIHSELHQIIFNGSVFIIYFYNSDIGYEFVSYDGAGNEKGNSKIIEKMDFSDASMIKSNPSMMTDRVKIYSNGKNGFIIASFSKNKETGFNVVGLDNNAKQIWSYKVKTTAKLMKQFEIKVCSPDILSIYAFMAKNSFSGELESFCILLNPKTGEQIKEINLGTRETGIKNIINSFVNEKTNKFIQIGEFYKPNDYYHKDKSLGFYISESSLSGVELLYKQYKWVGDIDKFDSVVVDEEAKHSKSSFTVFFHDLIVSDNGSIFLIGEQYVKYYNGSSKFSISTNPFSGISPTGVPISSSVSIGNMIVAELNSEYDLLSYKQVLKKKNSVELPIGYNSYGTGFLGLFLSSNKLFNYSFTSKDKQNDSYDIVYFDSNRKENKESQFSDQIVGVISIKGGEYKETRIPINSETSRFWIQPGKPGFISITEYSIKERRMKRRLEPISY